MPAFYPPCLIPYQGTVLCNHWLIIGVPVHFKFWFVKLRFHYSYVSIGILVKYLFWRVNPIKTEFWMNLDSYSTFQHLTHICSPIFYQTQYGTYFHLHHYYRQDQTSVRKNRAVPLISVEMVMIHFVQRFLDLFVLITIQVS